MERVLILLLMLLNVAFASNPIQKENKPLPLIWSTPFFVDTAGTEFLLPTIIEDKVVFCSRFEPSKGFPAIALYEQMNGKEVCRWQKNVTDTSLFNIDYISDYIVQKESMKLCVTNDRGFCVIDMKNDTLVTSYVYADSVHGGIRLGRMGNKVLHYSMDGVLAKKEATISVYNPCQKRVSSPLVTLAAHQDYEFTFGTPLSVIDENGDSLLLFQTRAWNFTIAKPRVGLYAYNVTKQNMKWEHPFFNEMRDGTTHAPLVYDNKIAVFQFNGEIVALNVVTGETQWKYSAESSSTMCPAVIYGDTMLFRCDQGYVSAINPLTGALYWKTTEKYPPATLSNIEYYNGKLYFTAFQEDDIALFALSAKNGEYLWSSYGHHGRINGGIVVNPKTGHLFCASNSFVMCYDLDINDF